MSGWGRRIDGSASCWLFGGLAPIHAPANAHTAPARIPQLSELRARLDAAAGDAERQRRAAAQAAAEAAAAAAQDTAASADARVADVEREMAALLAAVEAQKAAANAKMRQLASLLHEM